MAADDREQLPPRIAWIARVGAVLIRVLAWTWRIRVTHDDAFRRVRAERTPFIFILWHGQLLPLLYHHRGENIAVLISEHGDGEIVARVALSLGYRTVRGSTSRGAARALLGLTRELREGHDVAVTPDGPRGPAKSFAPGALTVAQRAGAPLIAIAATASSGWHLRSWDRFLIPRPFARVHVAYSEAAYVEASDARAATEEADRMRALLTLAEERAGG